MKLVIASYLTVVLIVSLVSIHLFFCFIAASCVILDFIVLTAMLCGFFISHILLFLKFETAIESVLVGE